MFCSRTISSASSVLRLLKFCNCVLEWRWTHSFCLGYDTNLLLRSPGHDGWTASGHVHLFVRMYEAVSGETSPAENDGDSLFGWYSSHSWVCITFRKVRHGECHRTSLIIIIIQYNRRLIVEHYCTSSKKFVSVHRFQVRRIALIADFLYLLLSVFFHNFYVLITLNFCSIYADRFLSQHWLSVFE